jgi:hypothetical protein
MLEEDKKAVMNKGKGFEEGRKMRGQRRYRRKEGSHSSPYHSYRPEEVRMLDRTNMEECGPLILIRYN